MALDLRMAQLALNTHDSTIPILLVEKWLLAEVRALLGDLLKEARCGCDLQPKYRILTTKAGTITDADAAASCRLT